MVTLDFLTEGKDYLNNFNGKYYEEAFNHYKNRLVSAIEGMDMEAIDGNINELIDGVEETVNSVGRFKRKGKATDLRVIVALYMIPAFAAIDTDESKYFQTNLIAKWNERFPMPPIQASTFEEINDGFKKELSDIFGLKSRTRK